MNVKKYCFALDLKNDPRLIAEYEFWHRKENGWPEVKQSILHAGILNMEIFLTGNRLFMVIEATEEYDPSIKAQQDALNSKVQEWEHLMSIFQQPLPWSDKGEKWVLMKKIFELVS